MSSTYRRICLSHTLPLLLLDDEFSQPVTGELRHEDHPECLMAVGRFSYPLIEVWLPSTCEWVDVSWLRKHAALAQAILDGKL